MSISSSIEARINSEIDPSHRERARFVVTETSAAAPARILDAGCGRGFYLKLLSQLPSTKEVAGVDINASHLNVARNFVGSDSNSVSIHNASISSLPFEDNYFDFIVCSEVLEHVSNPKEAVSELRRVLRPGGRIAVTVPNSNFPFLWDPLNWVLMRAFGTHVHKDMHWLAGIWADHERLFKPFELEELFADFAIVKCESRMRFCWPFSHFLLYGIGKPILEYGGFSSLNRFSSDDSPGLSKRICAYVMALPSRILGGASGMNGVNICLLAEKSE